MVLHQEYNSAVLDVDDNGVATLTLTDTKHMNPFNVQNSQDLINAVHLLRRTPEAQVLILTGSGMAFSSGGDIRLLSSMDSPDKAKWTFDGASDAVRIIYELDIPVIAAVNGVTAGAGLALMMASDLILASENAYLFFSFLQIAFTADSGTSYFLARKLGYHKAAEILFFGKNLSAADAEALGLVNKVLPADQLLPEAQKWAQKIARSPMKTICYDKKLLRAALENDFYEMQELESLYQILTWASDDFKEGTSAFKEKRRPNFTGKWKMEDR